MDGVSDSTGCEDPERPYPRPGSPPYEPFRSMESLLETWLASARMAEIAHLVMLAKVELARRGVTLTWSISQTNDPGRTGQPEAET
jgi:hypothetical protein